VETARTNPTYPEPAPPAAQPASAVYAVSPFGSAAAYGVDTPAQYEAAPPPPAPQPVVQKDVVEYRYVPVKKRNRVVYYRRVKHRRPFSHSAAIVAGGAGAGAAIGALAGGGKGAGIGALAGGAGGLVYDRLTR
jgi:hypothetical protein